MKLSELKLSLENLKTVDFQLPNGELIPSHFHLTEVGKISKEFIDCGGTLRIEEVINLQLWEANDYDHRLLPEKFINIVQLSEKTLNLQNLNIEVEYQSESIQKFGLDFNGEIFLLTTKQTDCLAKSECETSIEKSKVKISDFEKTSCC